MKIRKKLNEGVWRKYKGKVEFCVRLLKVTEINFEEKNTAKILLSNFISCVTDWKGLTEEDGKTPFECTLENKEYLYSYYLEIREFVFEEIQKLQDNLDKSVKN